MTAILNTEGRPSATQSKECYLAAVRAQGFEAAHLQMLTELKARLEEQYHGQTYKIAEQADLIEGAFVFLAIEAGLDIPLIEVRDRLFVQIFGQAGKKIIAREQAEADRDVAEFMRETGITDEAEARRLLTEQMVEGMKLVTEHKDEILREADLMEQIEDVIGPVDWNDLGDE
jgi:hypothetical protein